MKPPATNQTFADVPTCPWCGFLVRDAWKLADVQEMACPDCGEPIRVERIVSEDYRTTRITG